ncbi:class I adenylate-forming enzyme family protein [Candidatus Poriferisocius sp.]|uniref:class I adenylate-forming enzyme family protein n=1 Tax=Candidatus Poriferisocius sp. TaxID=3101276 RepID=UPI003B01E78E
MELVIGSVFDNAAATVPARLAAVLGERTLTYGELSHQANQMGHVLAKLGVSRGDRVVTWSDNNLESVALFVALARAGAVFAPANARLSPDEAAEMVGLARPKLLVTDSGHAEAGQGVAEAVGVPLVRLGGTGPGLDLVAEAESASPAVQSPSGVGETDPHVVFFTSGSTGKSKGVVLSHRCNWLRTRTPALLEPRGATVCMYPMFHMGAWTIALQAWQARGLVVFTDRAEADVLINAVQAHQAAYMNCIPAVWRRVLEANRHQDMASLRFATSGTSATPPELLADLKAAFPNAHRRVFYGSTEAGSVAMLDDADMEYRPGSCGQAHTGVKVRLDRGELQTRSPFMFDGYFDNPEATAEAFTDDGWFRTGDLAEVDGDGFYSITGRVKDVIRTGGETVSPAEVEGHLADFPGAAEVAVVGIPDDRWGEVVCAVFVLAPGAALPALDDVRNHLSDRLARYKHPRRIESLDAIPRTPATLQVRRRDVVTAIMSTDLP